MSRHVRKLVVFLGLLVLVPAVVGKPQSPGGGQDEFVLKSGDTMTGDLDLGGHSLILTEQELSGGATNVLTFNGHAVCLSLGNCPDADTTYAAGAGLALSGTTFTLVACPEGSVLKVAAGAWSCASDADTDTDTDTLGALLCADQQIARHAGGAWSCSVDADALAALSCSDGQLVKFLAGAWVCASDAVGGGSSAWADLTGVPAGFADGVDDDTTYAAGAGLALSGATFALAPCVAGSILKSGGDGAWSCAADAVDGGDAALLGGLTPVQLLRSDASGEYSSGTLTFAPGTFLDVDGAIRVGPGSATNDDVVYFDDGANEWIAWRESLGRFNVSDDLDVWGNVRSAGFGFFDGAAVHIGTSGPDRNQWFSFFEDGAANGESLMWLDSEDRFVLTDDVQVGGALLTTGGVTVGGNVALNGTRLAINANGPEALQEIAFFEGGVAGGESFRWNDAQHRFDVTDDLGVAGSLLLRPTGPDGASSICFFRGTPCGEVLYWWDPLDRFWLTDSLTVEGSLFVSGDTLATNRIALNGTELWINENGPDGTQSIRFFEDGIAGRENIIWDNALDRFVVTDELAIEGRLYMHNEGPDQAQLVCFYENNFTCGEYFRWSDIDDRFEFSDDVHVSGAISSVSSARFKTNIEPIRDALEIVLQLRGVTYDRIEDGRREIGLIAEDVVKLVPEVVVLDEEGLPAGIDYSRLVALLVEAIEAQDARIDAIDARLDRLESGT